MRLICGSDPRQCRSKRGDLEAFEDLDDTMILGNGKYRLWQAHHWYSQHEALKPWLEEMAPGNWFTKGVHSPQHIVAVPQHVHNQITREQREFWDAIGAELSVKKPSHQVYRTYENVAGALMKSDKVKQAEVFSRYQQFVHEQKLNWSGYYISVDASIDDVSRAHHMAINSTPIHLGAEYSDTFEKNRTSYIRRAEEQVHDLLVNKPNVGEKWTKWLTRFGILLGVYGAINTSQGIAAPTQEQQDRSDDLLLAYRRILHQKMGPMGSPTRGSLMDLGEKASKWGQSMGFDDRINNSILLGLYLEGTKHR